MRSQQHEQRQLHKRLPPAPYWSVANSASGIEGDGLGLDNEDSNSKERSSDCTSTIKAAGLTSATLKRYHDNSAVHGGKRARRRRFPPQSWRVSGSCVSFLASFTTTATTTTRPKWLALAILGAVSASAAAALVFILLHLDKNSITATTASKMNKGGLLQRSYTPGEVSVAGSPGGQESWIGREEKMERTGAKVAVGGWRGRAGGVSAARVGGTRGGVRADERVKSGGSGGEDPRDRDSAQVHLRNAPGSEKHGEQTQQLPTLVHGGSTDDNEDGDNVERVEGEFGGPGGRDASSNSRTSTSVGRGGDKAGAGWSHVEKERVGSSSRSSSRSRSSGDRPTGEEDEPPVLSESVKTCKSYLKDHRIVPGDSWGTAPKRVQDAWVKMNCDQVLGMSGISLEDPPSGGRQRAIVLVWNDIAGWLEYLRPAFVSGAIETCNTECIFTNDRSLLPRADGVMFHGPTLKMRDALPRSKPHGVNYVFANLEPTTYRPVQSLLRNKQLMSQFDLRMTYERDSDVPLGYVGSSSTSRYFRAPKPTFQEKDGFGSPDAIAAFVSNCKAAGATDRIKYMKELMKHATVHSFGYCLHNREEPILVPGGGAVNRQENKVVLLSRYKFLLAFENNNQLRDYVTEKVYNGLQSGTLPVYWGAENVEDFVPKGSVVKASDFSSPAELGKHLKMLATNEEAYEAYFRWKDDPEEEKRFEQDVISRSAYGVNAMCRLCDRVVLNMENNGEP